MSKRDKSHGRGTSHQAAAGVMQIGPLRVNEAEHSISVDLAKVEGPDRTYDADVAWLEHRPGNATLVFAKIDRDTPGLLRSRLEVRYPPEDLLVTFWANSRDFFTSLGRYVGRWNSEARATIKPPVDSRATQSHSEWASYTYMSHAGTDASLDFYHIASAGIARLARSQGTAQLKLRPVVRVQVTVFELWSLVQRVQAVIGEIREQIPEGHAQAKDVPTTFADEAPGQDADREYGS